MGNDMKRYFYTDPLAASWMAKHFGMRFVYENLSCICNEETLRDNCLIPEYDGKIYIHPESIHLLEPQEQDQGEDCYGEQYCFVNGRWVQPHPVSSASNEVAEYPVKIDKRNGKPFMWPECEETNPHNGGGE